LRCGRGDARPVTALVLPDCLTSRERPQVFARPLKAKDRFIVVASDGVWQVLSNDEVAACVGQAGGDPAAACDIIYDSAAKRWAGKEDAPYRDDITSLVLLLQ